MKIHTIDIDGIDSTAHEVENLQEAYNFAEDGEYFHFPTVYLITDDDGIIVESHPDCKMDWTGKPIKEFKQAIRDNAEAVKLWIEEVESCPL